MFWFEIFKDVGSNRPQLSTAEDQTKRRAELRCRIVGHFPILRITNGSIRVRLLSVRSITLCPHLITMRVACREHPAANYTHKQKGRAVCRDEHPQTKTRLTP